MFRKTFFFFALILLITACKPEPKFDITLLYGEWTGADWLVQGKSSGRDAREVRFTFDQSNNYTASYGEQKESGTFRVEGSKLYTTAEDKIEKVVKVDRISTDSLFLDMNRVGQAEQLILVKN